MLIKRFFPLILIFAPLQALALVVYQGVNNEVEVPFTAPNSSNSFSINLLNEAGGVPANNFSAMLNQSYFNFLGGSFPGIGGDCPVSGAILPGNSCSIMLEFAPTSSGDSDDNITINYETTDFLGTIERQLTIRLDGHSETSGVSCPGLAPNITNINPAVVGVSTTTNIRISGGNFSPATTVDIPGLTVSSTTFIDDSNIDIELVSNTTPNTHDVTLTNECGNKTQANGVEISSNPWFDLRVPSQLTAANPVFTSTEIAGFNIDSSFGMQLNIANDNWNKFLRFDGVCGTTSQSYDIIVYRQSNVSRAMFSLWNAATVTTPYPGGNSWQRQYVGFWDSGTQAVNRVFGTQLGEGGVSWNLSFTNTSIPDGGYYRYHFSGGGQNGQTMEIWSVDTDFNDIALLRSFTSNKPTTGATNLCPGVSPFDDGASDYYITAVRVI